MRLCLEPANNIQHSIFKWRKLGMDKYTTAQNQGTGCRMLSVEYFLALGLKNLLHNGEY